MKKVFFGFLFGLFTLASFGQKESEHIMFKGVPVDGTLNEFADKLKAKGYEVLPTEDKELIIIGDFAGYKDCIIFFTTSENTKLVCTVGVGFPPVDDWKELYTTYSFVKEMLTNKYGPPIKEKEDFGEKSPKDDIEKYLYTNLGYCNYSAFFEAKGGGITLEIIKYIDNYSFVRLNYIDFQNTSALMQKAMDDL